MKQSNEALLNELTSVILNNAFDAIVYYLPVMNQDKEIIDFKFAYMNDSALNILTGTKEKYIGNTFLSLFPYAAFDGMFEAFKKTFETGKPFEDIFFYNYGEYEGWYRDSIIKYGEGIIVYFRDVTLEKKLELELKSKTSELEKALKEKELLLRETHHRIKNNLQIVSSMMNLSSYAIKDPYYQDLFNASRQRVQTMAIIHQKLYEGKDFKSINFNSLITDLFHTFSTDKGKKIIFKKEIEEISSVPNFINIGLIISELLTNSLKHAFRTRKEGEISISLKQENKLIVLTVCDNGTGMPEDFKWGKQTSLGLTIVQALLEQMNGKAEIESSHGTTFRIMIPVS